MKGSKNFRFRKGQSLILIKTKRKKDKKNYPVGCQDINLSKEENIDKFPAQLEAGEGYIMSN